MIKTNKHEVYVLVAAAGEDGISTTKLAQMLGLKRGVLLQHLWRLAKAGAVENSNPAGGNGEGHWRTLGDPYGGVKDVSDVEQRWLKPGEYRIEIPPVPVSVWGLAR